MHIRDLTDRVMRLNMVNSSCKTSLETLLYRQVSTRFCHVSAILFLDSQDQLKVSARARQDGLV